MKLSIDSQADYRHEITVDINGWLTTWIWYGSEEEIEPLLDFILDESLEEYLVFCS